MWDPNIRNWFNALGTSVTANCVLAEFGDLRFGDEPEWSPEWIPAGYSSIPWDHLQGVQRSADDLSKPDVAKGYERPRSPTF